MTIKNLPKASTDIIKQTWLGLNEEHKYGKPATANQVFQSLKQKYVVSRPEIDDIIASMSTQQTDISSPATTYEKQKPVKPVDVKIMLTFEETEEQKAARKNKRTRQRNERQKRQNARERAAQAEASLAFSK